MRERSRLSARTYGVGFVPLVRSQETYTLLRDAVGFALLAYIALRLSYRAGGPHGLKVGEMVMGRTSAAFDLRLTDGQVRAALSRLRDAGFIAISATNRGSVITLLDSSVFDCVAVANSQRNASPAPDTRPAERQPSDHYQEGKNREECREEAGHTTHDARQSSLDPAADQRLASDCLPELVARYPRHDVPAQLRAATRYVRRERSDEQAEVPVGWFCAHWMANAAEKKRTPPPAPAAPSVDTAAEASRFFAEQREKLDALRSAPEPAPGTLDHAIWLEARKPSAA